MADPSTATSLDSVVSSINDPALKAVAQDSQARGKKVQDFTDQAVKKIEDTPLPPPPKSIAAPDPAKYDTSPMDSFGSGAMWLAMFGSLMTKRPLTNALNAGAAVNDAYHQQDEKAFKQALDKWKTDTEQAKAAATYQMELYKDILNKPEAEQRMILAASKDETGKMLLDAKMLEFQVKAAKSNAEKVTLASVKNDEVQRRIDSGEDPRQAYNEVWLSKPTDNPTGGSDNKNWNAMKDDDKVPGSNLTKRAVQEKAEQAKLDPSVLTRGGLSKGDKEAIVNRRAALDAEEGLSGGDIAASQAGYKADSQSLNNIQKMTDSAEAYENTMLDNMKVAESLMDKGAGTSAGSVLNRWLQAGRKATNDPDVSAFDAALKTVSTEAAKIQSGSMGNTPLTDSAKAEANETVNKYDSPAAIKKVFGVLKKDADNKKTDYNKQITDIKGRISGKKSNNEKVEDLFDDGLTETSPLPPPPDNKYEINKYYDLSSKGRGVSKYLGGGNFE